LDISQIINSNSDEELSEKVEEKNGGIAICICGGPTTIAHHLISELVQKLELEHLIEIDSNDVSKLIEHIESNNLIEININDIPQCEILPSPKLDIFDYEFEKYKNKSSMTFYKALDVFKIVPHKKCKDRPSKTFSNSFSTFKITPQKKLNLNKINKINTKIRSNC
jgi:hypothetical protein